MVAQLSFRPDGKYLAAACYDHHVMLWDFEPIADSIQRAAFHAVPPTRLLPGHAQPVWGVAWSQDGTMLASGSEPRVVLIWDGMNFAPQARLKADTGQIQGLAFSRDGRYLVAAAYNAPTVTWNLEQLRLSLIEMGLGW